MNSTWKEKPLGEIIRLEYGKPLEAKHRVVDGPYPAFGANGEKCRSDIYYHDKPSIIVGRKGSAGEITLTDEKFWPLDVTYFVTYNEKRYALRFLYYLLSTLDLPSLAKGVKPGINRNEIYSKRVGVPSIGEQQRIVAKLDEAFAGIAKAKENAENNVANARAIFDSELNAIFSKKGEEWEEATVGDVCALKSGTTVSVDLERSTGDIPYVKVAEMTMPANYDGITTSIRFLNKSEIKKSWVIPAGAVIFPKRGGAILTNKKRIALVDMCADLNIMSVIPGDRINSEFLYFYFLLIDMRKLGSGSSIPQINNYDVEPLPIYFPNSNIRQKEIAQALRNIEGECQLLAATYERKINELDALKRSLLHHAFTGQL